MEIETVTDNTAEKQQRKLRGRPFKKGVSGNSAGRPKGRSNFRTLFERSLKEIINSKTGKKYTEEDFIKEYIQRAIDGDNRLYTGILDRVYGKSKESEDYIDDTQEIGKIEVVISRE